MNQYTEANLVYKALKRSGFSFKVSRERARAALRRLVAKLTIPGNDKVLTKVSQDLTLLEATLLEYSRVTGLSRDDRRLIRDTENYLRGLH